jgi:3-phosphoshikimate 1-carboxyvinyltransferase
MLPDRLTLAPIARFDGTVVLPGSKSLSNRILLLSALAAGETEVTRVLESEDTEVMLAALRKLGVALSGTPGVGSIVIRGAGGPFRVPAGSDAVELFLGNAGTAMRPLTAVLAAGQGSFVLKGVPRMHERPIGDLVTGLRQLGVRITCREREGFPPLQIDAAGLAGGTARISGATSSQFLSALLMAAPLAQAPVQIEIVDRLVSEPYVEMTLALMARFGVKVNRTGNTAAASPGAPAQRYEVPAPQSYRSPGRALVEGDASSASYFLAGAAITGGKVRVEGCGSDSLQGDAHFAEVLARMGAHTRYERDAIEVTGNGPLRGIDADLTAMPDAAMTLAVAALFAKGPTTLRGIGNWRVKETDRMAAVSEELGKLGARTEVGAESLVVHPPERLRPASIATYNDHRMAMAFSLAACGGQPIVIENPSCVAKTFPEYFDELTHVTVLQKAGA